ncbi:hypothetical protein PHET_09068 [Paragonimus heterotremus]|uniref:Uncharacterized protein n=1 Tax=Paragonimus heterotremus TaxID=100268 RepID=A0A8J4SFB9_9TREM|nr:hypothetical protein PHET_09068 [Paragonimus heterotremus]
MFLPNHEVYIITIYVVTNRCFHETIKETVELQVESKCNETHLWCPDSECVVKEAYCDGISNCTNGYDERSVQCPAIQIDGKVFSDEKPVEWDPQYRNETSDEYKKLTLDLCHAVDQALRLIENLFGVPNACHLVEIYEGSVFASLHVQMSKENLRSAKVLYRNEEFYEYVRSMMSHFPTYDTKYRFREEVAIASELR